MPRSNESRKRGAEQSSISQTGAIPKCLFGYEIIERIGEGADSVIYDAIDPATKQLFALKHVVVKNQRDERFLDQLKQSWEVGRQVNHRGLRRQFDLKIAHSWLGRPTEAVLVMEMVDGVPLDCRSDWGIEVLIDTFVQTADALLSLHALGYVHCDIKPGNVLADERGQIKVIDLGQACRIGTAKERVQGTPDFISPEQVKCLPVTPQTDVFGLGAMMYMLLSGRKMPTLYTVKKGENSFLLDTRIDSPHEIKDEVPPNLSDLVMECVRTNPDKRPHGMVELRHRLEIIQFSITRHLAPLCEVTD